MKRLYVDFAYRGGIHVILRVFGRYLCFAATRVGRYGNGRRYTFHNAKCLCEWFGPDVYDGCTDCGKMAE